MCESILQFIMKIMELLVSNRLVLTNYIALFHIIVGITLKAITLNLVGTSQSRQSTLIGQRHNQRGGCKVFSALYWHCDGFLTGKTEDIEECHHTTLLCSEY